MFKTPTLVIYWADDRSLLNYQERQDLATHGTLIAVTPGELLLADSRTGRKAAIRGTLDEFAPRIPLPTEMAA